ncbi:MAG TPA: YdcF family protein [Anaerolineales bacterium]|nr:YdcF family protein [Anaerolineales bacterium]
MAKHKPYDLIFVFGYGPVLQGQATRARLNLPAKLNALAAGMLFQQAKSHSLLFSGGATGGSALPSEAQVMAQYVQRRFHLPKDVCILHEQPTDTLDNFIFLANWLDKHPYQLRILYLCLAHHLERVQLLAEWFGIAGDFVTAQDVVANRSPRHRMWLSQAFAQQHTTLQENESRAMRGVLRLPTYWIPPLAQLQDRNRILTVLRAKPAQAWLTEKSINPNRLKEKDLRAWLNSINREFPN